MEIHHYIQDWKSYKRIIIVSDKGSVFVDLYQYPLYPHCSPVKSEIWALFVEESIVLVFFIWSERVNLFDVMKFK